MVPKFDTYILGLEFVRSKVDHCVYSKKVGNHFIYVVLYVDDCWSPVLIMFFPILYHKDLHFHTQYHSLLALLWHTWHLFITQWGYSRYFYVSSYFYVFWCFKLILKLIWLELGTISILKQDLPVPGTSSHPVEIPTKLLKIRALWPEWETVRFTW